MSTSGVGLQSPVKKNAVHERNLQLQDVWLASVPIVLSIHIWSILHVLEEVPAWILRLTIWELFGAIAYTQVFAMLESMVVLVLFIILYFILPKRWFARQFVSATSLIVLVATSWAIAAHNYDQIIRNWGARQFLPWLILVVTSMALALILVFRSEKIKNFLSILVKRAAVLSAVYLLIDGLSLIIIMLRNL